MSKITKPPFDFTDLLPDQFFPAFRDSFTPHVYPEFAPYSDLMHLKWLTEASLYNLTYRYYKIALGEKNNALE